jgi:hypothetical protein
MGGWNEGRKEGRKERRSTCMFKALEFPTLKEKKKNPTSRLHNI